MGSDNQEKGSSRAWGKLKIVLVILTSFCLIARIALSDGAKNTFSKKAAAATPKSKAPSPPPPPVVPVRPVADSPDYDPYFVNIAKDFKVASDFDIGKLLHKQGFRVTKNQAKDMLRAQLKGSLSEAFLLSHDGLLASNWASQGIEIVPLLYHGTIDTDGGKSTGFQDKAALQKRIEALANHEFVLEVSSVALPKKITTGSEKYIFAYDNHTWNMDSLNPVKFINLLEFFAERTFRGAYIKETLSFKQTAIQHMMPQDEVVDSSTTQSFLLMPRFFSPQALRNTCMQAGGNSIAENLDQPIELKVLVLWGKAYMATCYSPICNPFAGTTYTPAHGPRYVIYPDGKSKFLEGTAQKEEEVKCAEAVDAHIKSKLDEVLNAAEKVAETLGAPWLRADLFVDEKAKNGAFLHRVRSADTAVSGWVTRSDRAMAVVARGFESRSRIRGYPQPKTQASEAILKDLGCAPATGGHLACRASDAIKLPLKTNSSIASP